MRTRSRLAALLLALASAFALSAESYGEPVAETGGFSVSTTSFAATDKPVSARFAFDKSGCGGMNVSPDIAWTHAPLATKSYAITLFDPDARAGRGWWHWLVFDIPASVTHIGEAAAVPGGAVESVTDFGTTGYKGPCPPAGQGAHRYVATVYALDIASLPADRNSPPKDVNHLILAHALARASFTFLYARE